VAHSGPTATKDLPRDLTSFVGRRRELGEVREAMSSTPLLTLMGPAGVGKTRLALRTAADTRRAFPDGVCVAELAELRDPALLAETVASALGLRDASARWLVSTLVEFLAAKRMLLVLDNCEHLADVSAVLADSLLRACPELKILCTSREPLGVDGETVMQVAPLPLPEEDRAPSADTVLHYDAVRLFNERARAAWPQFELTPSNAAEVVALCRRLDGLPLALELAAVRLRAFTVGQILEQMDRPFQLLSAGKRTGSVRHQSLKAALDWSFGLLSKDEQIAWRRLSIFAGSFDLEAAEAICSGDGLSPGAAAHLVAALVDKSILRRELSGVAPRFRMLETIRDYGRARLREAGEEHRISAQHRAWYADLALKVFEHSWGSSQLEWWDRADRELPNLRDVLRSFLAQREHADQGLMVAANLFYYWLTKGSVREGRHWIDALLEAGQEPTAARAMALAIDGWLAQVQGDMAQGLEHFVESEKLASSLGDAATLSLASVALGGALIFAGDLDRAEELAERCMEVQEGLPDRRWAANALAVRANVWSVRGDHSRASDLYHQATELCREAGDRFFLSRFLPGAALAAWHLADLDRAEHLEAEALRLSRTVDDKPGMAIAIEVLAWIAASTGRAARAARLLGGVQTLWESIPARLYPTLTQYHDASLGEARSGLGDEAYDRHFREGTRLTTDELVGLALEEHELVPQRASDRGSLGGLTPREAEIAGLVAQGLSNRDIASKLVISQRTAETHVEHILMKLGFTSRAQIAAWVVERMGQSGPLAPSP
jgi:predicted ATPase/DNA-binding CsgD family transcriptional regulator